MFLINLLRRIRGFVRFTAKGPFAERFLNLMARERIAVWDVKRRGETLTGCVTASAYSRMRPLAKKAGVRLRLASKHGAPFKRKKLWGRRGLLIGFGLFVLFIGIMSRFIWSIQVNGNETVPEETILTALEEIGIKPGILRSSINVRESETKAMLLLHELSWIALNIDGSTIHVEINEALPPPVIVDPHKPCNVVASHSGQITEMRVYAGQPVLQEGQAVLEGQVMVSGITQDRRGQNLFRHARADIFAEISHEIEVRMPLNQTTYIEKGKTTSRGYLRVFSFDLPLFLPLSIERPYKVERTETPMSLFSVELPLTYKKEVYTLMEEVPVTYTEEEAREMALRELHAIEAKELEDAEILKKNITGSMQDGEFRLNASYLCKINIAVEKEILHEQE